MGPVVSMRNWLTSFYQSAVAAYASGNPAGFSAWVAIRGGDSAQSDVATLFGNSDDAATGWRFTRLADVTPAAPDSRLIPLAFQIFSDLPGSVAPVAYVPSSEYVGREFLLGATFSGNAGEIAFYVNGARLAAPLAFANNIVPGASRLRYGIRHAAGDSTDELISAAYTTTIGGNLAARDTLHAAVFNQFKIQSGGFALQNALSEAGVAAAAIYESYRIRGPFLVTPTNLLNGGTDGVTGDLTFNGAAVLQPRIDTVPNFTGATFGGVAGAPVGQDYGFFYSVTSAGAIAAEAAFPFVVNGAFTSGFTHVAGSTDVVVVNPGVYAVDYAVEVDEASQIALFLDGVLIPGTIFGSAAISQQNTGSAIITTVSANQVLTLRNHTSAGAITPTVGAGGVAANNVSSLRIRRLS